MVNYNKRNFPTDQIRTYLEPGPIVLVSSMWKNETNIMTMGWHTVMEFTPSLVGCVIAGSNHSFDLIRKSKECVINIPAAHMVDTVIGIGNCSGDETDKFKKFSLTPAKATKVSAPIIKECFANLECRIEDTRLVKDYNFFILKVLKAHVATKPKYPQTLHYRGHGIFTLSGKNIDLHKKFTNPANL